MSGKNYYAVLRVRDEANFETLRKAYRARAMECHPDRFAGHPKKEEEFKLVVEAFNVLSDPLSRRRHDLELAAGAEVRHGASPAFEMGVYPVDERAILDTLADDILEELIVGNALPRDTSLQTLMLDLEQTEQFCLFREAKTCLYNGATGSAEQLFRQYITLSPGNILARYFLAKCCVANGKWADAEIQLKTGIRLGSLRRPPLQLVRLQRELEHICKGRPGFIGVIRRLFLPPKKTRESLPADEAERRALHRAINRLAVERLDARPLRGELGPRK
jgi:hypothetical protein